MANRTLTQLFADQLRRQLGTQERETKDGAAEVVVCLLVFSPFKCRQVIPTIGIETKVAQKVVGVGLADIAAVEIQGEKGNAGPEGNLPVQLVDKRLIC